LDCGHNKQRKAAVINDLSCFGRCSLTVTLPILSALKVQCCPVPTAIFTNHTGYPSYAWTDYTNHLDDFISEWEKLGLRFDAIATGFLGSARQIAFVRRFLDAFRDADTVVAVDPVMGDHGQLYSTYSTELAQAMRHLLDAADILTPNLTEACILAEVPYNPVPSDAELSDLCERLAERHPRSIVISGIERGDNLLNAVYEKGLQPVFVSERKIGCDRSGTGDVFFSVILGNAVNGIPFAESVRRASAFVAKAVAHTSKLGIYKEDGLAFEELLGDIVK
jgi:pyridoxine kinase